ncbi:MAG: alpha-L-rhamnosidase [Pedobacter sp.]|nr:MAG: alpha-L-rhamnosidase [Pedobacter sp.]
MLKLKLCSVRKHVLLALGLACGLYGNGTYAQQMKVQNLKVDHLSHPDLEVVNGYPVVGHQQNKGANTQILNKRPVFGWELTGSKKLSQKAYRLVVALSPDSLKKDKGLLWDSGKVLSAESVNIPYAGPDLQTNKVYFWRVLTYDQQDQPSAWSPISRFRTAETLHDYQTSYYPLQKTDENPRKISYIENVNRLDFGRASFGQLKLTVESANDTDTLTVRFGEAIKANGEINRAPGGTIRYAAYPLPLRKGKHTYAIAFKPDPRNTGAKAVKMPDYIGEVLPFRYVEVAGLPTALGMNDAVRATVHYPFNEQAAYFKSSDTVLNAVWELCKYSMKATSFAGIYVDGDRERIAYEADAYINQLSHYSVDKEYSLARRSHEYLLHNATWPTEWILQSVLMAYNDFLYTGDIRSAQFYYDDLKAKLLIPLREKNGLISTKTGKQSKSLMSAIHYDGEAIKDIVDWPHTGGFGMTGNGETDGFVFSEYNTVVNAFHYKALLDMAILADKLGKQEDKKLFTTLAQETHMAFQKLLWNAQKKAYNDGVSTEHASLHSNMMAMAFGLVPAAKTVAVNDFIRSRGMACSVYGSQFLMDAVYDAGDGDYGLKLLASKEDRSWYNMIRAGSTVTMEAWDNKFKPNQDWNHAWGAVPANVIPRKLMGITPLAPGWKKIQLKPQIGSLQQAEIRVPTINGTISISCKQSENYYVMEFNVPITTTADVKVPVKPGKRVKVKLNGETMKVKMIDGYLSMDGIASGDYLLEVTY